MAAGKKNWFFASKKAENNIPFKLIIFYLWSINEKKFFNLALVCLFV